MIGQPSQPAQKPQSAILAGATMPSAARDLLGGSETPQEIMERKRKLMQAGQFDPTSFGAAQSALGLA
jgi:hypothetical protein